MSDAGDNEVFRRVYETTSQIIRELCTPFRDALLRLKADRNGFEFGQEFDVLVERILFTPLDQPPLAALSVQGVTDPRRTFVHEMFVGLGVNAQTAQNYTDQLMRTRASFGDDRERLPSTPASPNMEAHWRFLLGQWRPLIWRAASTTLQRLEQIVRDAATPYRGRPDRPGPGIEQTVALLKRFPDLAERVYRTVGFTRVRGFPPQRIAPGQADDAESRFERAVQEQLDADWWTDMLCLAGLVVVSVALTVLTFGTLGPAAATLVGAGIGTTQGGVLVLQRSAAVSEGRVAVAVGMMDPATLRHLERELGGAWATLFIDIATGGIMGRFGGGSILQAGLRGMAISGAGGGLSAAVDPNVWDSPDRVALILRGTVIGAVAAGVGVGVGVGANQLLQRNARIQIALDRGGGPLRAGRTVLLSAGADMPPLEGTVVRVVDRSTVVVRVAGGEHTLHIDDIIDVRRNVGGTGNPIARAMNEPIPVYGRRPDGTIGVRTRIDPSEVLIRFEYPAPGQVPLAPHRTPYFSADSARAHGITGEAFGTYLFFRRQWREVSQSDWASGPSGARWHQTTAADLLRSYPDGRFVVDMSDSVRVGSVVFVTTQSAPSVPLRTAPFEPGAL